jgi:hypothetical protein
MSNINYLQTVCTCGKPITLDSPQLPDGLHVCGDCKLSALQAENERLRRELGIANQIKNSNGIELRDREDKLRRIAELRKTIECQPAWLSGCKFALDAVDVIASGPLIPDWRGMCEKIYEILCGLSYVRPQVREWLKEYEEVK